MGLDMSMILIEGVIQVTINPGKLRNMSEEEWQLLVLGWTLLVCRSKWVHLVELGVHDLIGEVPMGFTLMPVELRVS